MGVRFVDRDRRVVAGADEDADLELVVHALARADRSDDRRPAGIVWPTGRGKLSPLTPIVDERP